MQSDELIQRVLEWCKNGWLKTLPGEWQSPQYRGFFRERLFLHIQDGWLFYKDRIIVPADLRTELLKEMHQHHMGKSRMMSSICSQFWWPQITSQIAAFLKGCPVCQRYTRLPPQRGFTSWNTPAQPMDRVHIDFFTSQVISISY